VQDAPLPDRMRAIVGPAHVLEDAGTRALCSQDLWTRGVPCELVVRPADAGELSRAVAAATGAGHAVVARGGGMSYTQGYLPAGSRTVVVDCSRLDRVLEINAEDMYVTVEAGCTWQGLHAALEPRGLRTPYWGTLSGRLATVGGSLSQNSIFWGSGQHGSAADSVLSLRVVLADGSVIETGSASRAHGRPFFRHFGPDLTGLFTCDCGALGIKAAATLRLLPVLPVRCGGSWDFGDHRGLLGAMAEVARRGLAMECWATDPTLGAQRARRERLVNDIKALAGVVRAGRTPWRALADALRLVLGGRRFMRDLHWPMHVQVEARADAEARALLREADAIARHHGGRPAGDSIPKVLRANPFPPVNNVVGPGGERWAPVHALVPLSQAATLVDAIEALYARRREEILRHGVLTGYLFTTVGHSTMAVEPLYFWPDALGELAERTVEPAYLAKLPRHPERADARAFIAELRGALAALFRERGAAHLQLGRTYSYAAALKPEPLALVRALKQAVDPRGLMNPGVLGL
jgi:glycolate oxidase